MNAIVAWNFPINLPEGDLNWTTAQINSWKAEQITEYPIFLKEFGESLQSDLEMTFTSNWTVSVQGWSESRVPFQRMNAP